jgi:NTE family protein
MFALDKMDVLEDFARQLDWKQIVSFLDLTFPRSGLIEGERITDVVRGHVREINIEELPIRYCAVATDLTMGSEVVLNEGDLIDAIRASISVPGIFTPVQKNGSFLIDGGIVNPVPVSAVRNMGADYVIAVDLNADIAHKRIANGFAAAKPLLEKEVDRSSLPKWRIMQELTNRSSEFSSRTLSRIRQWVQRDPVPSIFDVLTTAINIMEMQITATRLAIEPPDMLIQPRLGNIRFLEYHRAQEAIEEGYREATAQLMEKWNGAAAINLQPDPVSGRTRNGTNECKRG